MFRLNHALPLALLVSVSAFAMQEEIQVDLVWKKNEEDKLVKVKEATAVKPPMTLTWAKQEDGQFVATEGIEVSKPLTKEERSIDLLSTIAISTQYTEQQSILNQLQQDKDAAIKAEADQLDKLKVMATELSRKLTAKQAAETGSGLAIENYKKQIAELQKLQDAEATTQKATATDVEKLKASLAQTAKDVATAEAAKKAADAANKKTWWSWSSKSTTTSTITTPATTAVVATPEAGTK